MAMQQRNVMIVDDDSLVHYLSKKVLSTYSCINKIYSAYNGQEALEILNHACSGQMSVPTIVLLDLHMPVMNGFQFYTEAMEIDCLKGLKMLTVMFSSTCDPVEINQAHALGIDYFFSKPILMEKIEAVFKQEFP
ncbi:response regulator [Chryseolinea lacunae]|uniref:Response regulator n=1 Tax=Chryseolinea lacunae TaxID=2801331 RepID=A0ABS1KZJ5_9BACT|nr:response regulator [Chryseolinea lacunae]MBL0744849.1 response regulator [Chryseolinea lacunae]